MKRTITFASLLTLPGVLVAESAVLDTSSRPCCLRTRGSWIAQQKPSAPSHC